MRSSRSLTLASVFLLLLVGSAAGQVPPAQRDILFASIRVGMTQADVDSVAVAAGWKTVASSGTMRKYRKEAPGLTSTYEVRFHRGSVRSMSAEQTASKQEADRSAGITRMMKQAIIDRAEHIEGKGNQASYIHTASDGSTIYLRWVEVNARTLRVAATVKP